MKDTYYIISMSIASLSLVVSVWSSYLSRKNLKRLKKEAAARALQNNTVDLRLLVERSYKEIEELNQLAIYMLDGKFFIRPREDVPEQIDNGEYMTISTWIQFVLDGCNEDFCKLKTSDDVSNFAFKVRNACRELIRTIVPYVEHGGAITYAIWYLHQIYYLLSALKQAGGHYHEGMNKSEVKRVDENTVWKEDVDRDCKQIDKMVHWLEILNNKTKAESVITPISMDHPIWLQKDIDILERVFLEKEPKGSFRRWFSYNFLGMKDYGLTKEESDRLEK